MAVMAAMRLSRRAIAVLGVLLAGSAIGAFLLVRPGPAGLSTVADRAQVTGYTTTNFFTETGAVSVQLHGASAARIEQIIDGLPVNTAPICNENFVMYRIAVVPAEGRAGLDVVGYACGSTVVVTSGGRTTVRYDAACGLDDAVRRVLPASVTATQRTATCAHW
jgi:hypothetical protein